MPSLRRMRQRNDAIHWAKELTQHAESWVLLHMCGTNGAGKEQAVRLVLLNGNGQVLLDKPVRPLGLEPSALALSEAGLTKADLMLAPSFVEVVDELSAKIGTSRIIAFGAERIASMIMESANQSNSATPLVELEDARLLFAQFIGQTANPAEISLTAQGTTLDQATGIFKMIQNMAGAYPAFTAPRSLWQAPVDALFKAYQNQKETVIMVFALVLAVLTGVAVGVASKTVPAVWLLLPAAAAWPFFTMFSAERRASGTLLTLSTGGGLWVAGVVWAASMATGTLWLFVLGLPFALWAWGAIHKKGSFLGIGVGHRYDGLERRLKEASGSSI